MWLKPRNDSLERLHREIALHQAAEDIGKPITKARAMANTGAKGFAAVLKAHVEDMRKEFSKLHDEVTGEFAAMKGHLETGRAQVAQLKSDNAELREAFGIENDTKA